MSFLQNLLTQHNVLVIGGIFTFVSLVLNGIAQYLQAIGDQVPGWIGSVIGFLGTATHFLNGNLGGATAPSAPSAPSAPASGA